jgi:hypothetical protein
VTVTVEWPGTRRSFQRWLLLDTAGRTQLALDLTAWDRDELTRLAETLGILQEVDPTPHRPIELRRLYPGAIHWTAAHPYRFTFALIAALSVVIGVLGGLT